MRSFVTGVSLAALTVAAPATASHDGCTITAQGPFLYHTTVFPVVEARCSAVEQRIRVATTLTRDGVVVRTDTRDCRKASVCYHDFDVSVEDIPGNQAYCTTSTASVLGHTIGTASSCESEEF
jgi:hypothetical protein